MNTTILRKKEKYEAMGLPAAEIKKRLKQVKEDTKRSYSAPHSTQKNKAAVTRQAKSIVNPYLAALLDPERSPVVGVPDEFGNPVHLAKVITQVPCVFNTGESSAIIRPTLRCMVEKTVADTVSFNVHCGDFDVISGSKLIENGRKESGYTNTTSSEYPYRKRKFDAGEGSAYAIFHPPKDVNGFPSTVSFTICDGLLPRLCVPLGPNVTVTINFQRGNGAGGFRGYIKTFNETTGAVTRTNASAFSTTASDITNTIVCPAGATHLYEYGLESDNTNILEYIFCDITGTVAAGPEAMAGSNIGTDAEYDLLANVGQVYRITALSVWAQYTGSMTSNGRIAIGGIATRSNAATNNRWKYSDLSVTPGCYAGPLNKGGYAFYKPLGLEDLTFRNIDDIDDSMPYIAVAIIANDVDAQSVSLRICAHIEIQTTSQVMGPMPSLIEPLLITDAFKVTCGMRTGMENDTHVEKLARVISKGASITGDVLGSLALMAAGFGQPEIAAPLAAFSGASSGLARGANYFR